MISSEVRQAGKLALSKVVKGPKNVEKIESLVSQNSETEEEYKEIIFQSAGDLLSGASEEALIINIKAKKMGWSHEIYEEMFEKLEEQNSFLEKPFEIEEGVLQCKACGSKRVFSYSKQVRSSDEGTSVFARCVACNSSWTHSG